MFSFFFSVASINDTTVYMPLIPPSGFLRARDPLPAKDRFQISLTFKFSPVVYPVKGGRVNRIVVFNGPATRVGSESEFFILYLDEEGKLNAKWNHGDVMQTMK